MSSDNKKILTLSAMVAEGVWTKPSVCRGPSPYAVPCCCKAVYIDLDTLSTNTGRGVSIKPVLELITEQNLLDSGLMFVSCATRPGMKLLRQILARLSEVRPSLQNVQIGKGFYLLHRPDHFTSSPNRQSTLNIQFTTLASRLGIELHHD
jgi:hypothetical protein